MNYTFNRSIKFINQPRYKVPDGYIPGSNPTFPAYQPPHKIKVIKI